MLKEDLIYIYVKEGRKVLHSYLIRLLALSNNDALKQCMQFRCEKEASKICIATYDEIIIIIIIITMYLEVRY